VEEPSAKTQHHPINNPGSPTVTRNIKQSRAACERSHAGEARFLWFFLFRKKKEQSPHAPARRASPPHGEHANKQAIRGASAPSMTLSASRAPGPTKIQRSPNAAPHKDKLKTRITLEGKSRPPHLPHSKTPEAQPRYCARRPSPRTEGLRSRVPLFFLRAVPHPSSLSTP